MISIENQNSWTDGGVASPTPVSYTHLLYKFNNRTLLKEGSYPTDWGRPWIYFRLADFYLYYAEAVSYTHLGD